MRRRFFRDKSKLPVRIEVWNWNRARARVVTFTRGDDTLEEFYYFIAGQGVMWMDDEEFEVGPGDAVMASPGVDHGFRCVGDETLKLVIAWVYRTTINAERAFNA